ncbi:MAG: flagellar basal body P-ring protein FlgI, partial [Planctomycetales bacterium]|nr:flagellar basal body P-ring protein FlgI [Planctomycetales bacterium]
LFALVLPSGCSSSLVRSQSPDSDELSHQDAAADEEYHLVGDLARAWGMNWVRVEGLALITGLKGTGSDPPPSPRRSHLLSEMQTRDVDNPERWLASPDTALAIVYGYLRPGIRKGERFDVAVKVPHRSKTTSLRSGFLMLTRLREMAVLDNAIHSSLDLGLAQGDVLVDALYREGEDGEVSGRVLGGGIAKQQRDLGLVVRKSYSSVQTSSMIASAINARFFTYEGGGKSQVATPKRDNFIDLKVAPRYRKNPDRYMAVVRSIAISETPAERAERIVLLGKKLLEPTSAASAALELEAIGEDALEVLRTGLDAPDRLVRFYAAEALAYLEDERAAKPLGELAREDLAMRRRALTALAVMDHVDAYE